MRALLALAALLAAADDAGLTGRAVLERLQALRAEYYPRLVTQEGRSAFERQLGSMTAKLERALDKPTGVTEEHLGAMSGLWESTVRLDLARLKAKEAPSAASLAALAKARLEVREKTRGLDKLPPVLKPEWARPDGPEGGPAGRRRPPGLGAFLLQLGDAAGARQSFDEQLAVDPRDAASLGGRAAAALHMGDYGSAYRDARTALEVDPGDRVALGLLKLAEGRGGAEGAPASAPAPAAAAALAAPAAAAPAPVSDAGALEALRLNREALAALRLGDRAAALAAADRALAAYAANPVAHLIRARAALQDRDYRAALASAEAGLAYAPDDRSLLATKGRAALRLKQAASAGEAAARLLASDPADAEGLALLAHAKGLSGDREEMVALLRKAAASDASYRVSLESALAMPPGADQLFLFPGEQSPEEVLAALRAAKAAPAPGQRVPWALLAGSAGGLLLAGLVCVLRRRG